MGSKLSNRKNGDVKVISFKTERIKRLERIFRQWGKMIVHHIFPTSRGGNGNANNRKEIPGKIHWIYHELFGQADPEEAAILVILLLRGRKKKWTEAEIDELSDLIINNELEKARQLAKYPKNIETLPYRLSVTISRMRKKQIKKHRKATKAIMAAAKKAVGEKWR